MVFLLLLRLVDPPRPRVDLELLRPLVAVVFFSVRAAAVALVHASMFAKDSLVKLKKLEGCLTYHLHNAPLPRI